MLSLMLLLLDGDYFLPSVTGWACYLLVTTLPEMLEKREMAFPPRNTAYAPFNLLSFYKVVLSLQLIFTECSLGTRHGELACPWSLICGRLRIPSRSV